jgi:hypothetical protein
VLGYISHDPGSGTSTRAKAVCLKNSLNVEEDREAFQKSLVWSLMSPKSLCVEDVVLNVTVFRSDWITRALTL